MIPKVNLFLGVLFQSLFSIAIGGIFGLICFAFLFYFSRAGYGLDQSGGHGIAEGSISRLGGLSICVALIVFYVLSTALDQRYFSSNLLGFEWIALTIGFVGLLEDIKQGMNPYFRLFLTILVVVFALIVQPDFLPKEIDFYFYNEHLNHPILLTFASLFFLLGFTHAGNVVDGANGLLAITVFSPICLIYLLTNESFYFYILLCLLIFMLFNMTTGKIFLGDFGSYFFASLTMLALYYIYDEFDVSVWMLVAIVAYPCLEVVRSIYGRILRGRSPFLSDNDHVHNYLHLALRKLGLPPLLSNSLTGLLIGFLFSTLPFLFYLLGVLEASSYQWFYVVIGEILILSVLYKKFRAESS